MKKKTLVLILLPLVLGLLAVNYTVQRMPEAVPLLPVPTPNGYDDLVAAGGMLQEAVDRETSFEKSFLGWTGEDHDDAPPMALEELKELVAASKSVLERVRLGLGRECVVPVQYELDLLNFSIESFAKLRRLGNLLVMKGMVAERDENYGAAAKSYLDCVRLGIKTSRGGFFIHSMFGHGGAWLGLSNVLAIRDRMSSEDLQVCLTDLAALQRQKEPVDDVQAREETFVYENTPFFKRLTLTSMIAKLRWKMQAFDRHERALYGLSYLILALELHERKTGSLPRRLSELSVPGRDIVPGDPFSDGDFVYRKRADGYELYSVGPDGEDDLGRAAPPFQTGLMFGDTTIPDGDIVATEAGRTP